MADNPQVAAARQYLLSVSNTPGDTMRRQGTATAIGRMEPTFVTRLATAVQQARAQGIPASVYSAYRPPAYGVGGYGKKGDVASKFNSLHAYGMAVDVAGIGAPGSATAQSWYKIATGAGIFNPYGPFNKAEWNHFQAVPEKGRQYLEKNPQLRESITANGPIDLEKMWAASGVNGPVAFAANQPQPSISDGQRTLKKGDEGMDVAALQMRLQNAGLYKGPIDGKFGAGTAEAVRATERAANLRIDKGVAGPQVQGVLANSLPQFPSNPAAQPGMDPMLASYQPPIMANAPPLAGPMDTAAFGFGPKLPPAPMFPSGGPVPPASIPAPYAGNGPGRSPTGPAPIAMSPTLGTKDDTVAPSDPALTASNPFQMPQPWGPVADQSVDTLANRLPAPSSAPGFGLLASNGTYASVPRSAWTGDSSVMSKTFRDPFGMPNSSPALPSTVPFGFAQAGGAGNVMNGADVSGGRNLALMGRAPVNMANATPAATTTPALMRNDANAQSFGNFLRSIGTAFGGASTANASVPAARYDPLSSARMPMAPAMPAINQPAPATITPQQFQQRFAPMGTSSIPQDVTYRVASLNPVISNSVSMAPKTISKADFSARFADPATPTSKLGPSPFALGGAASGVLAPSASPLGAALAGAGGFGIGVPQEPAPVQMTPMRKVARVAVPLAASAVFGPVAGLAARGIMGLINGGPIANRVGQAISYVNAVARSNPYAASPFTPAGFTSPNFSPKGGGSIYAYQSTSPGAGSYINSAGRTVNYNVNADQRVYGNYSGGFGGFQP